MHDCVMFCVCTIFKQYVDHIVKRNVKYFFIGIC